MTNLLQLELYNGLPRTQILWPMHGKGWGEKGGGGPISHVHPIDPKALCKLTHYSLGRGAGVIITNEVVLVDSAFHDINPPTFTLQGDTSGGPPVTYSWRRNGQELSDGGAYSISIRVNDVFKRNSHNSGTRTANQESLYRSTLVVTGDLPGVYEYSVTMLVDSFSVEGSFYYT